MMNPLELACVMGHEEILLYFVKKMNLKSKSDFLPDHQILTLEQMPFIFVPLVQKDAKIFEILMSLPQLWSFEELKDICVFLKHSKWREGLQIFFRSNSVHRQYKRLSLPERFRFIQDCLMIPYELCLIPKDAEEEDISRSFSQNQLDQE
mmetsp:Transcript_1954/g.3396  ORF Transcript_1954/g.3396 Transcript_1954/m.3396 type:complete len:150 (+) Transcript_1954:1660-2109(+)